MVCGLVEELGHEVWIGDAAQIRASYVRKQKTDKRDAAHILKLLVEGRFPRLWTPERAARSAAAAAASAQAGGDPQPGEERTATSCPEQGMQRKRKLWSQAGQQLLRELAAETLGGGRREDLLELLAMLNQQIGTLDRAVQKAAEEHPQAQLLMTQPGVGPITALAFVLTMGDVSRFPRGKQVASYLGLIPREHSSGGRQKLGAISKQGNRLLRMLLVEAAQTRCAAIPDFASSICIAAIRSRKAWPKWQRREVGGTTLLDAAHAERRIQRSFASRAARGCPWSAQARPMN